MNPRRSVKSGVLIKKSLPGFWGRQKKHLIIKLPWSLRGAGAATGDRALRFAVPQSHCSAFWCQGISLSSNAVAWPTVSPNEQRRAIAPRWTHANHTAHSRQRRFGGQLCIPPTEQITVVCSGTLKAHLHMSLLDHHESCEVRLTNDQECRHHSGDTCRIPAGVSR